MARPPRLAGFSYIGKHRYFLTFATHERRPYFDNEENVDQVRAQLVRTCEPHCMAIHAYCFMSDHVHLFAEGRTDTSDLRAFMTEFKQQTGWQFRRDRQMRLWQGSYYDHVLRPEEGTPPVLAYVVNNPVVAGIVADPLDYPFWGSLTRTREEIVDLIRGVGEWKAGGP